MLICPKCRRRRTSPNRLDQPRFVVFHVADPRADLEILKGTMRIVSWNVQSLTAGPEKVVPAVLDEEPSLIALQEYPSAPCRFTSRCAARQMSMSSVIAVEGSGSL